LGDEDEVELAIGENHIRATVGDIRFTSKLIDGRFPEYDRVIPKDTSNELVADRQLLKSALQRTSILSNEKYRGIRLIIKKGAIMLQAHNPEQEEAEDEMEVAYSGDDIEIGFNVTYLLDALGAIESDEITLSVLDGNSSCLLREPGNDDCKYVVMPMRL
jgi:DNA polymerase-3 subunit beta